VFEIKVKCTWRFGFKFKSSVEVADIPNQPKNARDFNNISVEKNAPFNSGWVV